MVDYIHSATLLLGLLNPFLLIVYLVDVVEKLGRKQFALVLLRAGLIATAVFCCFAILGDAIFTGVVHAKFASFQVFGGVIFLLIGLQFVFRGPTAIEILRGESKHLAGAIAMPVLIGPGSISASVIIGERHEPLSACVVIAMTVVFTTVFLFILKTGYDYLRPRRISLVQRYIEVAGRITALYVGTVAIEMIMQGIGGWLIKY